MNTHSIEDAHKALGHQGHEETLGQIIEMFIVHCSL